MAKLSVRLPLFEIAQVNSIKLPIHETVWVVEGFIITENIIEWKLKELVFIESIKGRILIETELVDRNHLKIKWHGDAVPKIQIFRKRQGEAWGSKPLVELPWNPQEYIMELDTNGYEIRVRGVDGTGEADDFSIGMHQPIGIDVLFSLPLHQKHYYTSIDLVSTYKTEINL